MTDKIQNHSLLTRHPGRRLTKWDTLFHELDRFGNRLSGYHMNFLKGVRNGTLGALERLGDGLTLGTSTALSRGAWGTSFFDDVRNDAYESGMVPGVLTDGIGLGIEAAAFLRGPGRSLKQASALARLAARSPLGKAILSKVTEPSLNALVAAAYGANQAADLNRAAENARKSAATSLILDAAAQPAGYLIKKGISFGAQNPYIAPFFKKIGTNANDFIQNRTRDIYGRLEKVLGAEKLNQALSRARQLKRSLIEVLDPRDIRGVLSETSAARDVFAEKRAQLRTQNAGRVRNIIGRHLGKEASLTDDDALLDYYRKRGMDYYKSTQRAGDLEKYELARAFERLPLTPKEKLGIKKPEEYLDILNGQSAQVGRPILEDIGHLTYDAQRKEFVDTLARTYREPDISAIAYNKNEVPRKVLMKKYLNNDKKLYDLIIEHDDGIYTKFPKKDVRGIAEQFKEPFYDLYAKDKNLIKGYRPLEKATLGNPSAKANLTKDIGMGPSEVRDFNIAQNVKDVKGYVDGLDNYLKTLANGQAALLKDAKGRVGRVPFLSHVGRATHYNPVISSAVKSAKQMPSLANLPDTEAPVLLHARDILNREAVRNKAARKAVADLDFAVKTAYPDYGTWLRYTPGKDVYNKFVSNPRFNPLNDLVHPNAFKKDVSRLFPPVRTKILQNTQKQMMENPFGKLTYQNIFSPSFKQKMTALTSGGIVGEMVNEAKIGMQAIANLNLAAKRAKALNGLPRLRKSVISAFEKLGGTSKGQTAAEFLTNPAHRLNPADLRVPWKFNSVPSLGRLLTVPVVKSIGAFQDEGF